MPSWRVHRDVTGDVYDVLCSMYGGRWPCDIDINEVVEHVVDPDRNPDTVLTVTEKCVCDGKEVDITYCREQSSYVGSGYSRRCIVESRREERGARHHGGLNEVMWRYYLLLAARSYVVDNDRSTKCCWALARALHYAQDSVLSRKVQVVGVFGTYTSGDFHDLVEDALDTYAYGYLKPEILQRLVMEGVNAALREPPMRIRPTHEFFNPDVSVTAVIENAIKATAYTFAKFFEIINYANNRKESIGRVVRRLRLVSGIGIAVLILSILLMAALHQPGITNAMGALLIIGLILTSTWPLYRSFKESELYVLGIVNYPTGMLRIRMRRGASVITETYKPLLT